GKRLARNNAGLQGLAILSPLGGPYAPCPLGCCFSSALHSFRCEVAQKIRPESHHHASPLCDGDDVLREWHCKSKHASGGPPGHVRHRRRSEKVATLSRGLPAGDGGYHF